MRRWLILLLLLAGCTTAERYDATLKPQTALVVVTAPNAPPGRGFFVTPDGTLVTARHVLGDELHVTVRTTDGRELPAIVQAEDREYDLAILKVPSPGKDDGFLYLHLDDTDAAPGMHLRAFGERLKQGVFDHWEDFGRTIDFTASVTPADAGAPLLADDGRVIGVVSGTADGHSRATPAWRAIRLLPERGSRK